MGKPRKLAKPKPPAPPKVRVRIQSASLEIEMTDGRGRVRSLSIEGENITSESLGALVGGIAGAIGGRSDG